jgi:decaprenyl-phosphate phosphoribosyltransferase
VVQQVGTETGGVSASGPAHAALNGPARGDVPQPRSPRAILASLRPRQWVKNLLVFVAPAAAGRLGDGATVGRAVAAFAIFVAVASGMYLLNDVLDLEADRLHPEKCERPVAAGLITIHQALSVGAVLVAAGLVSSWFTAGWRFTVVMALYVLISASYSIWVKYVAVVELASVTSGFVLRAIAGGVATNVPLSDWFLAVTSFSAMFIAIGKRYAEYRSLGEARDEHRLVLSEYTPTFLQSALTLTATGSVTAYCLWAFDRTGLAHPSRAVLWTQLTVVPFAVAVLYVLLVLDKGGGAAPEELALKDRWLQLFGVVWLAFFLIGIYA